MDKLRAVTFTYGRERDVKQASHIAAARFVWINVSETDRVIPLSILVHAHHVK